MQVLAGPPGAGCAVPSPRRQAALLTPSHSPAALPDTNVTLGSGRATVPCHIAGCQDRHCHRHEASPDGVYVTSPPRRSHYLSKWWKHCTVSCVCAVLSTELLHISFTINAEVNKIREEIFDSRISNEIIQAGS